MDVARKRVSRSCAWYNWHHSATRPVFPLYGGFGFPVSNSVVSSRNSTAVGQPSIERTFHPQRRFGSILHGASGFLNSLRSLLPHFPGLRREITSAIENAERCVLERGVLRKSPSLCHGLYGNALSLPTSDMLKMLRLSCPEGHAGQRMMIWTGYLVYRQAREGGAGQWRLWRVNVMALFWGTMMSNR
jgi:hypothetical protein